MQECPDHVHTLTHLEASQYNQSDLLASEQGLQVMLIKDGQVLLSTCSDQIQSLLV